MILNPTGKRPITLDASTKAIAQAGERPVTKSAKYSERWNRVTLYRSGKQITAAVEFLTDRKGEEPRLAVYQGTPAEVAAQLETHDPLPPGYGWPPIDRYASENATLRKILSEQWSTILHDLLSGDEFQKGAKPGSGQWAVGSDQERQVRKIVQNLALPSAASELTGVPKGTLQHWIKIERVKSYPMADERVLVNVHEVRTEQARGDAKTGPKTDERS